MTSVAVEQAEAAANSCRAAVLSQGTASVDHADFYALAGHAVDMLRALDGMARVLAYQVSRYGTGLRLYDDEGAEPAERLDVAAAHLGQARAALASADTAFNDFWSAIGHIGVEVEQ